MTSRVDTAATTLASEVAHETLERPSSRARRLGSARAHGALRSRSIAPDLDTIVVKALAHELPHKANLFDIHMKYGSVLPLDEVLRYVQGLPSRGRGTTAAR